MGACRYPSSGGDVGSNLGYVMGDLVEQGEGTLLLEYHNGDTCGDGTRSMVHVHFTCGAGAGTVRSSYDLKHDPAPQQVPLSVNE